MSDGTYRGRWMDEVCGTSRVSPEVKVLLLTMARWMDESGHVSVPRERLAELMRCAPRRVSSKLAAACDAGLLERSASGRRGRTAEFQAIAPDTDHPSKGDDHCHPNSDSKDDGCRHPKPAERVTTAVTQSRERVTPTSTLTGERKGASRRHPNGRKGDDSSVTQSTRKGDDSRHPSSYTHTDVDDHDSHAVVVDLFDEEAPKKKTHTRSARASDGDSPEFAEFWDTYPRKVAKGAARKAWAKAIKNGADPEAVILGARRYATDPHRVEGGLRYTAHPATWLNAERWADETEPAHALGAKTSGRNVHHEHNPGAGLAEAFQ